MNPTFLYVAAIYAVAVWLARRAGIELRWRIAAFFYLLVLLFLWKPMTGAWVNLPVDFIQTLPPWAFHIRPQKPVNSDLNDLVLQIAPWAHQVRESWLSFDAPLWNPLSGAGYPLLANGQSSAFSLVRLLALPLPLAYAFTAEAAWKILIALTFTFLYCRRRGYSELASAVGAIAFGFSTFIVTWLHFPLITVACFVPAVLYSLDLLIERRTYGRFVFAAALWAAMLFGGHPETVSHTFFIAALSLVWILAVERPFATWREAWRLVLILGGAMFVAALLATPFLGPFLEGLKKSKRYHELQANPNAIGYYSDWASAVVLIQPDFFGDLPYEKSWGPSTAESITGFAGILGAGAWIALAVHVVATRRWRSREMFFVVATLIVVGILLAWPGFGETFHFFFKLAANARLRLLLCLLLAFQFAALVDLLQRGHTRIWLIAPLVTSATLLYLIAVKVDFPTRIFYEGTLAAMLPSLLTLLAAALTVLLGRWREFGVMVVAVLTINELWTAERDWNPTLPTSLMYPTTPLIEKLVELKEQTPANEPFRIVGAGPVFFPNTSAMYGLEDIRSHDPMANGRYLGLLRVLTNYETHDYFAKWENSETKMLDLLNVKYLVAPPLANLPEERWALVYHGRDGRVFENRDVLPRFFTVDNVVLDFRRNEFVRRLMEQRDWPITAILDKLEVENDQMRTDFLQPRPANSPRASMQLTEAGATTYRMKVTAPRYTLVVSSVPWWPGWKVTRNGESTPVIRVNGAFVGYAVPPGTWDVRVWYSPWSYWVGVWVAVLTVLALAAVGWRRRRMLNVEC